MSLRTMAPLGCVALMLTTLVAPPLARAQDACYTRLPTERISLDLREAPVQTLLRLLSKQYRVNMVVTEDVAGTVTVSFFDLPVRDVFRGILEPNNLQCVEFAEGIFRVSSASRIRGEQQAGAVLTPSPKRAGERSTSVPELGGIMSIPEGSRSSRSGEHKAILSNQVVAAGDIVNGYRVEQISGTYVEIRSLDGREHHVLTLPRPSGTTADRRSVSIDDINQLRGNNDSDVLQRLGAPKRKAVAAGAGGQSEIWTYDDEIWNPSTNRPYEVLRLTLINRRVSNVELSAR